MSITAVREVLDLAPVAKGTLLVLLGIAERAKDDTRTAYPGIQDLGRRARLKDRQVYNCLRELEALGIIEVEPYAGPRRTHVYRITPAETWPSRDDHKAPEPASEAPESDPAMSAEQSPERKLHTATPCKKSGPDPATQRKIPLHGIAREPEEEPEVSKEPEDLCLKKPPERSDPDPEPLLRLTPPEHAERVRDPFDQFWDLYPRSRRKTDRPKARQIFRNLCAGKHRQIGKTRAEDIIEGCRRWAASQPDPEYVPLPTTWLNGERWSAWLRDQDEDLSPARRRQRAIAANGGYLP